MDKAIIKFQRHLPGITQNKQISWAKLSNKKITRLESDIELDRCEFNQRLVNRNPRNLELSSLEHKPKGFWLEKSPQTDWNVVVFKDFEKYSVASLQRWYGKTLISVSTQEPQLAKYFRGPDTVHAAKILGKILSRRCQQSGYLCAGLPTDENNQTPKIKAFVEALSSEGFILEEPIEIEPRSNADV